MALHVNLAEFRKMFIAQFSMQPEVHIPPADCLANPDYPLGGGLLELVQILDR